MGHPCVVFTDHAPLHSMLKVCHSSGKLAHWSQNIAEFNVEIKYRPGRKHSNADALLRSPTQSTDEPVGDVSQVSANANGDMAEQRRLDLKLNWMIQYIQHDLHVAK